MTCLCLVVLFSVKFDSDLWTNIDKRAPADYFLAFSKFLTFFLHLWCFTYNGFLWIYCQYKWTLKGICRLCCLFAQPRLAESPGGNPVDGLPPPQLTTHTVPVALECGLARIYAPGPKILVLRAMISFNFQNYLIRHPRIPKKWAGNMCRDVL